MRNKNSIISILCVVVVIAIVVAAFFVGRSANESEVSTLPPAISQSSEADRSVAKNNSDIDDNDIRILNKYSIVDGDDYTVVMILENLSKEDVAVAVVGKVYDDKKTVVGTERESVFLDPGAHSVVVLDFDTEGTAVDDDSYKLSVAKATSIKPGIKSIESENALNGQEVSVISTNNNAFDLEGVDAICLFYKDGNVVDVKSEDVENEATEIFEKGTTQKQTFVSNKAFNVVKVYYAQSQDKKDD